MDALVWRLKETDPEAFTEVQAAERVQQIADGFAMKQDELWGILKLIHENAEDLPGAIVAAHTKNMVVANQLPTLLDRYLSLKEVGKDADATVLRAKMQFADRKSTRLNSRP